MTKSRKTAGLLPAAMAIVMVLILTMTGCSRTAQTAPAPPKIASRSSAAGFLVSKAEESGGFIGIPVQREKASEYAYLYDNALAVIIMSRAGEQSTAEMIADAIVFAQSHDRTFKDGRLRNVYIAGDPRSDSRKDPDPRKRDDQASGILGRRKMAGGALHRLHFHGKYGMGSHRALRGGGKCLR